LASRKGVAAKSCGAESCGARAKLQGRVGM
jgi:hypothetical protein